MVYELGKFHQNYRRYVRSFDPNQMHENGKSVPGISACAPYRYRTATDEADPSLPDNGAIVPCGQISHSFFNDSYTLALGGSGISVDVRFFFHLVELIN